MSLGPNRGSNTRVNINESNFMNYTKHALKCPSVRPQSNAIMMAGFIVVDRCFKQVVLRRL